MMTYREALKDSMDTFMSEKIEVEDIVQEPHEILPLPITYFIKSMAAIIYHIAYTLNGNKQIDLRKELNPLSFNPIEIGITMQIHTFMQWLLSQEIPSNDEDKGSWCNMSVLFEKWNEFVKTENNR